MTDSIRWRIRDRYGNEIYLSDERWEHITEPINHPEMTDYEAHLEETITLSRHIRKLQAYNMEHPNFNYDEISDTLYISFSPGESATGIELNDHILLRLNKEERRAVGMTLFEYSLLAQRTEIGPRSFPLTGLAGLALELRELVREMLLRPPLNEILSITAYTPSLVETIPIVSVHPLSIATT